MNKKLAFVPLCLVFSCRHYAEQDNSTSIDRPRDELPDDDQADGISDDPGATLLEDEFTTPTKPAQSEEDCDTPETEGCDENDQGGYTAVVFDPVDKSPSDQAELVGCSYGKEFVRAPGRFDIYGVDFAPLSCYWSEPRIEQSTINTSLNESDCPSELDTTSQTCWTLTTP